MTPTAFVDRIPTFTAAQWDGSEESATFILDAFGAKARKDEQGGIVVAGVTGDFTLDPGTWVMTNDSAPAGAAPMMVSDVVFAQSYVPKS